MQILHEVSHYHFSLSFCHSLVLSLYVASESSRCISLVAYMYTFVFFKMQSIKYTILYYHKGKAFGVFAATVFHHNSSFTQIV